jgi:hypothetical protein
MEGRLATTCPAATNIVERYCLIIMVRLRGATNHMRGVRARLISINLEYLFHRNSSKRGLLTSILISLYSPRFAFMLRCAVLSASVGTALRKFRNPALGCPLGSGAGPILIAGCGDKLSASLSKNACRFGYDI